MLFDKTFPTKGVLHFLKAAASLDFSLNEGVVGNAVAVHKGSGETVNDLIVDKMRTHHPVAFYAAQSAHKRSAYHIAEHFLRSAGLHTGTAGNEFGTGENLDRIVGIL